MRPRLVEVIETFSPSPVAKISPNPNEVPRALALIDKVEELIRRVGHSLGDGDYASAMDIVDHAADLLGALEPPPSVGESDRASFAQRTRSLSILTAVIHQDVRRTGAGVAGQSWVRWRATLKDFGHRLGAAYSASKL